MGPAPLARGLIGGWVPTAFWSVQREAQATLWAPIWDERVAAELSREPADVIVSDFAAAEFASAVARWVASSHAVRDFGCGL
jgi:hypothetical protein